MLSTNSTSSIQKRRQQHRRQQSLEVPILVTHLPANSRRARPASQAHRRGLSLDQSLTSLSSSSGFRPLLPQDQGLPTGSPPVRIQLDTTNIGHQQPDQQHFVQETQSHIPDQPGHLAQDFNSHLRQQLNGNVTPTVAAPTPTHASQEQALQELQHHLEWYRKNFGHSPAPPTHTTATVDLTHLTQPIKMESFNDQFESQTSQHQPFVDMPQTPLMHGQAHTVPNTPQHYIQAWPSPPPTNGKHVRSQSFQYDVAPMPASFEGIHVTKSNSPSYNVTQTTFSQPAFATSNDAGYASSIYSSSIVDPTSPACQNNFNGMPTLFEEPTPPLDDQAQGDFTDEALLQAAAGASDDFNSPNFMVGGSMGGMSPRTAMLHNLGEEVNASIIDTGIPAEQIDAYLTPQHPHTKGWSCLYVDPEKGRTCNKFFKRKENARSHVQNHLGDRQFQCNDCGKTFVRQHDMKRHAAIHSDDRPHVCPCGSGFARHDALTRHRQRGMCSGALPGFEKSEEDKPKRGRPKKERPDMDTRTSKAKRARKMDNADAALDMQYASSFSSAMSENSLPMTPPDYIDPEAFISLAQTPPTSPPSPQKSGYVSPAALFGCPDNGGCGSFTGVSSPENGMDLPGDYNLGAIGAVPDAAQKIMFSEAFSPEYSSIPASSPPSSDEVAEMEMANYGQMSWGGLPLSPGGLGDEMMAAMLDRWLEEQ